MELKGFVRPVVMIGCGNMAGAILNRWLESGLDPARVTIVDPGKQDAPEGVTLLGNFPDALPSGAVVVLGVKPQLLPEVAPLLAPLMGERMTMISMLAGVRVRALREALQGGTDLVRIMPNTPVALGKGVCAWYADDAVSAEAVDTACALLAPLGLVERIEDEAGFNLVTALSGCGPAFVFRFVDALAQAATSLGMANDQALRLALATVEGSAALAVEAEEAPGVLADRVASKGGMTREGLDMLDEGERLNLLLADTLRVARDRGEVLEKLAR
jgi:pyrroline-5-carboxylate reductase